MGGYYARRGLRPLPILVRREDLELEEGASPAGHSSRPKLQRLPNQALHRERLLLFFPMNPPFDLIYIALEPWDEVWRRNQPLCAELIRSGAARRIVYVEPPRVVPYWLVRPAMRRADLKRRGLRAVRGRGDREIEGITAFAPLQLLPNTFAPFRAFNTWHERQQLRAVSRRARLQTPTLYTNSHWAAPLAGTLNERGLVYDIGDDWLAVPDKRLARIKAGDALLCRASGVTIVVSQRLRELKTPLSRRVELVPNGVDVEHYKRALAPDLPVHPLAQNWRKPVLGYLGSIHAERVDLPLIEALAEAFPDATIALVGPILLSEADKARLEKLSNVALTGAVPFEESPAVLRAFDLFLVPHVESDFTRSLNPLKLGEYLAIGKPIVSTRVAGFAELEGQNAADGTPLCRLASGVPAFIAQCRAALQESDARAPHERREIAQTMSWTQRVARVADLVREVRQAVASEL